MYFMRYCISNVFGSFLIPPTAPLLPLQSPLPCPMSPFCLLGPVPSTPTISQKPMPQTSAQSSLRSPESAALQCTVQMYSASSGHILPSNQTLPLPSLYTLVCTTRSHPPVASAASPQSARRPCTGNITPFIETDLLFSFLVILRQFQKLMNQIIFISASKTFARCTFSLLFSKSLATRDFPFSFWYF